MARLKSHLLLVFKAMLLGSVLCSCAGIIYSPGSGNPGSGDFNGAASWGFRDDDQSSYTASSSSVEVIGGVARLKPASQTDNSLLGFGNADGGTFKGSTIFDTTNSVLRLSSTSSDLGLDASWINTTNLVGYWKLNESGAPFGVNDEIYGGTGSLSGGVKLGVSGKLAKAASFSGTGFIDLGNPSQLQISGSISIGAWVKASNINNGNIQQIVDHGYTLGPVAEVYLRNDHGVYDCGSDDGSNHDATYTVPTSDLNAWVFLVCVYDGAKWRLYRNGAPASATTTAQGAITVNADWVIGATAVGPDRRYFSGSIDDVSIWNRPLSATEVAHIYQHQSAQYGGTFESRVMDAYSASQQWNTLEWVPTLPFYKALPDGAQSESRSSYTSLSSDSLMSGLVGLWHLDETASTPGTWNDVSDASGKGNVGEFVGAPLPNTPGVLNSAINMNTAGYIKIKGNNDLPISTKPAYSLAFWVKASSSTASKLFGERAPGGYPTAGFFIGNGFSSNKLCIDYRGDIGQTPVDQLYSSTQIVFDNKWHHVVYTDNSGHGKVYIDGKLDPTSFNYTRLPSTTLTTTVIGAESADSGGALDGILDEFAIWKRVLTADEALQLYRRGANRIKYQVRSCSDSTCSSGSPQWLGPDGTSQSFFSEVYNTASNSLTGAVATTLPTMNFTNFSSLSISNNRYFQYRAILESDDANNLCNYGSGAAPCSRELKSVHFGPDHYDNSAPTIGNTTGVTFSKLSSATNVLGANGCTNDGSSTDATRYILSSNNTTWYYWNGSAWIVSNQSYNLATSIGALSSDALATFVNSVGAGKFYYKAFLKSDGTHPCEIDELNFTGSP